MVQDFMQKLATVHAQPSAKTQILEQMKNWMTQHGGSDVDTKLAAIGKIFDQASALNDSGLSKKSTGSGLADLYADARAAARTRRPGGPGEVPGRNRDSPRAGVRRNCRRARPCNAILSMSRAAANRAHWIYMCRRKPTARCRSSSVFTAAGGDPAARRWFRRYRSCRADTPSPASNTGSAAKRRGRRSLTIAKPRIRWLRANAAQYHLDPGQIGVWGQSSGGHLVAMLGVTGDKDSRVQAVCDWSGSHDLVALFDLKVSGGNGKSTFPIIDLLGGQGVATKEKAGQASPITHVNRDAAPFLIMHGDRDPLIPIQQSELLDAALRKAGVECKFVVMHGAGHGFGGANLENQVAEFFDKHLKMKSESPSALPAGGTTKLSAPLRSNRFFPLHKRARPHRSPEHHRFSQPSRVWFSISASASRRKVESFMIGAAMATTVMSKARLGLPTASMAGRCVSTATRRTSRFACLIQIP